MGDGQTAVGKPAEGRRALVYGGGVAALMSALELAARGLAVELVGPAPAERWPALPDGGINTGHDAELLYRETIRCGGYLAQRPPVRAMAAAAKGLVCWLASVGVPFQRDDGGALALRRLDGATEADAAYVDGQTAAQITHALAGQVARVSTQPDAAPQAGTIRRHDSHALVALVLDDDRRCIGGVVQDLVSMAMVPLAADAVVLATAGPEQMFGSPGGLCPESAAAVALAAGAIFANADLVQLHPATIAVPEGRRYVLSSAIRAETGRFWVPREAEDARRPRDIPQSQREYFLADAHPGYGDQVPDDLAARAVGRICWSEQRGVYDAKQRTHRPVVYLDISHLPEATVAARLGPEAAAWERLTGIHPADAPLEVTAGATGSLGGLWLDHAVDGDGELDWGSPRNHSTSIRGLYGASGAGTLYHGGCRLGGNGLLADLFGARLTAGAVVALCERLPAVDPEVPAFADTAAQAAADYEALLDRGDDEDGRTPGELAARLRSAMSKLLLSEPTAERVTLARQAVAKLAEQAARACPDDWSERANRGAPALRELHHMLRLAEVVVASAQARLEGEPDAPQTVLAQVEDGAVQLLDDFVCTADGENVRISRAIDPGDLPPEPRRYGDEVQP